MNTSNPNTNFSTKQPASKHVAHTKKIKSHSRSDESIEDHIPAY